MSASSGRWIQFVAVFAVLAVALASTTRCSADDAVNISQPLATKAATTKSNKCQTGDLEKCLSKEVGKSAFWLFNTQADGWKSACKLTEDSEGCQKLIAGENSPRQCGTALFFNVGKSSKAQHKKATCGAASHHGLLGALTKVAALRAQHEAHEGALERLLDARVENARLQAQLESANEKEEHWESYVEVLLENAQLKAKLEVTQQYHELWSQHVDFQQKHHAALAQAHEQIVRLQAQLESTLHKKPVPHTPAAKPWPPQPARIDQQALSRLNHLQLNIGRLAEKMAELERQLRHWHGHGQGTHHPIKPATSYAPANDGAYRQPQIPSAWNSQSLKGHGIDIIQPSPAPHQPPAPTSPYDAPR